LNEWLQAQAAVTTSPVIRTTPTHFLSAWAEQLIGFEQRGLRTYEHQDHGEKTDPPQREKVKLEKRVHRMHLLSTQRLAVAPIPNANHLGALLPLLPAAAATPVPSHLLRLRTRNAKSSPPRAISPANPTTVATDDSTGAAQSGQIIW
jgi:hypothetical protein